MRNAFCGISFSLCSMRNLKCCRTGVQYRTLSASALGQGVRYDPVTRGLELAKKKKKKKKKYKYIYIYIYIRILWAIFDKMLDSDWGNNR